MDGPSSNPTPRFLVLACGHQENTHGQVGASHKDSMTVDSKKKRKPDVLGDIKSSKIHKQVFHGKTYDAVIFEHPPYHQVTKRTLRMAYLSVSLGGHLIVNTSVSSLTYDHDYSNPTEFFSGILCVDPSTVTFSPGCLSESVFKEKVLIVSLFFLFRICLKGY